MDKDTSFADFLEYAQSVCSSKAQFSTRAEAQTFVNRSPYKGTPYRCAFCRQWHLTTMNNKAAKRVVSRIRRALQAKEQAQAAARAKTGELYIL